MERLVVEVAKIVEINMSVADIYNMFSDINAVISRRKKHLFTGFRLLTLRCSQPGEYSVTPSFTGRNSTNTDTASTAPDDDYSPNTLIYGDAFIGRWLLDSRAAVKALALCIDFFKRPSIALSFLNKYTIESSIKALSCGASAGGRLECNFGNIGSSFDFPFWKTFTATRLINETERSLAGGWSR